MLIRLRGCAGWSVPLMFAYDIRHIFAWPSPYGCLIVVDKWDNLADLQNEFKINHSDIWTQFWTYMYNVCTVKKKDFNLQYAELPRKFALKVNINPFLSGKSFTRVLTSEFEIIISIFLLRFVNRHYLLDKADTSSCCRLPSNYCKSQQGRGSKSCHYNIRRQDMYHLVTVL